LTISPDGAYDIGMSRKMHQTTVRFAPDLWETIEAECRSLGISAAQFVREAAIARVAFAEARRDASAYAAAMEGATGIAAEQAADDAALTNAVLAQSQMARDRARRLRSEAENARGRHMRLAATMRGGDR
jgi:hypothetical protein